MSSLRDDYNRRWAGHKTGTPSAQPLGPHHRQNTRRVELELLCDWADRTGRRVLLGVGDRIHHMDTPQQRRDLDFIAISTDNDPFAGHMETIRINEKVSDAAYRLRRLVT